MASQHLAVDRPQRNQSLQRTDFTNLLEEFGHVGVIPGGCSVGFQRRCDNKRFLSWLGNHSTFTAEEKESYRRRIDAVERAAEGHATPGVVATGDENLDDPDVEFRADDDDDADAEFRADNDEILPGDEMYMDV